MKLANADVLLSDLHFLYDNYGNVIDERAERTLNTIKKSEIEFDMDMILNQLEDYGKYKGILHTDKEGNSENYIPVSVVKQIVKNGGLGEILDYMKTQ